MDVLRTAAEWRFVDCLMTDLHVLDYFKAIVKYRFTNTKHPMVRTAAVWLQMDEENIEKLFVPAFYQEQLNIDRRQFLLAFLVMILGREPVAAATNDPIPINILNLFHLSPLTIDVVNRGAPNSDVDRFQS